MNKRIEKNILAWLGDDDVDDVNAPYKAKNLLYDDNLNFEIRQAICRLIETRPRVTKEFVTKWSEKIYDLIPEENNPILDDGKYPGSNDPIREYLIAMLRELGNEMEKEK